VSPIVTVNNEEVKRMNLNVPIELHNAFKAATATRGQNMTDELLKFIRSYIVKHSSKPARRRQ
jgi:ParG